MSVSIQDDEKAIAKQVHDRQRSPALKKPNRMKQIYQRQEIGIAPAEAWRLLGERLEMLTSAEADNIVMFGKRTAK